MHLVMMEQSNCYGMHYQCTFSSWWGNVFVYVEISMRFGIWKKEGREGWQSALWIVILLMILLVTMYWLIFLCMGEISLGIKATVIR